MSQADIGLIGLGVMGRNLVLNMLDHGHTVAVYNRTPERTRDFLNHPEALAKPLIGCESLEELVAAIAPPRPIMIMVQAGDAVDEQIEGLIPYLSPGDIVMDGGNANYHDTRRRDAAVTARGLHFLGVGVSGGEEGARHGPSIMVGGAQAAFDRVAPVLGGIAADFMGSPCCALLGPDGAGHLVKTIHNGIEYADMQMIAEVYDLMRHGLGLGPTALGEVFKRWNDGPLDSYLIEITSEILPTLDPDSGKPMVDIILDRAGQKGTGRWAAIEALDLGIPAVTIDEAVGARGLSSFKAERVRAEALYGLPAPGTPVAPVESTVDALERALLAGKIAAYAQGFAVIAAASDRWEWNVPLADVARIWRAGCIIRSRFLDRISVAFEQEDDVVNLLAVPDFVAMMKDAHKDLRRMVALAATSGIPMPALGSALAYFEGYRRGQSPANLIQAQRDFFGAHGFERTDRDGSGYHGPWALSN